MAFPAWTAALLMPAIAQAGMAMPTFTDIAHARIEVLSFFLAGYIVLAVVYRLLWNSLARDFPKLPRLSYRGALGMLAVCGLFIYVVLTMISGARELLTPGAWARSGVLYKIREPAAATLNTPSINNTDAPVVFARRNATSFCGQPISAPARPVPDA